MATPHYLRLPYEIHQQVAVYIDPYTVGRLRGLCRLAIELLRFEGVSFAMENLRATMPVQPSLTPLLSYNGTLDWPFQAKKKVEALDRLDIDYWTAAVILYGNMMFNADLQVPNYRYGLCSYFVLLTAAFRASRRGWNEEKYKASLVALFNTAVRSAISIKDDRAVEILLPYGPSGEATASNSAEQTRQFLMAGDVGEEGPSFAEWVGDVRCASDLGFLPSNDPLVLIALMKEAIRLDYPRGIEVLLMLNAVRAASGLSSLTPEWFLNRERYSIGTPGPGVASMRKLVVGHGAGQDGDVPYSYRSAQTLARVKVTGDARPSLDTRSLNASSDSAIPWVRAAILAKAFDADVLAAGIRAALIGKLNFEFDSTFVAPFPTTLSATCMPSHDKDCPFTCLTPLAAVVAGLEQCWRRGHNRGTEKVFSFYEAEKVFREFATVMFATSYERSALPPVIAPTLQNAARLYRRLHCPNLTSRSFARRHAICSEATADSLAAFRRLHAILLDLNVDVDVGPGLVNFCQLEDLELIDAVLERRPALILTVICTAAWKRKPELLRRYLPRLPLPETQEIATVVLPIRTFNKRRAEVGRRGGALADACQVAAKWARKGDDGVLQALLDFGRRFMTPSGVEPAQPVMCPVPSGCRGLKYGGLYMMRTLRMAFDDMINDDELRTRITLSDGMLAARVPHPRPCTRARTKAVVLITQQGGL
ncbi:hypothetical protein HK101_005473 [Irineochytrium annulatum]|nr:hypothetical protein HK101_005473 [Irineochytrium annulatum]